MSNQELSLSSIESPARTERLFTRFNRAVRWEHMILLISFTVLLLTGLPQKYRTANWSQQLLATPERLTLFQTIHKIAAVILILLALYHIGSALLKLVRRQLPGDMLITWQDIRDAAHMLGYLLFIRKGMPAFGKYNFEQKITYWFFFFGIAIMIFSGMILWFPELITRFLPGTIIPAAKLAHSTEAVAAAIFLVIWHFYHVHLQRLNLSIFTGTMNEKDMQTYHSLEYERLTRAETGQSGREAS